MIYENIFLSLLSEPLEGPDSYKGLYRLFDFDVNKFSKVEEKEICDFYYSLEEGKVKYSQYKFNKMKYIFHMLKKKKWNGDMVIFSDKNIDAFNSFCSKIPDFKFVGYDICSYSYYFSVIGSELFFEYDPNLSFFSEMSQTDYIAYCKEINKYGLFNNYDSAKKFSNYCNYINEKHEHAIESETNWHPICMYISR